MRTFSIVLGLVGFTVAACSFVGMAYAGEPPPNQIVTTPVGTPAEPKAPPEAEKFDITLTAAPDAKSTPTVRIRWKDSKIEYAGGATCEVMLIEASKIAVDLKTQLDAKSAPKTTQKKK